MTKVFISYSRKDIVFIKQLAADMKFADVDAWYDLSGLEGGTRWSREIEKAIKESQYIIVVLSPDSVESIWVEEEIIFARKLKKRIIPLLYKPCEIPLGFHTLNFIDVQDDKYQQNYKEILRALGTNYNEREGAEKNRLRIMRDRQEKIEEKTSEQVIREKMEVESPVTDRIKIEENRRQNNVRDKTKKDLVEDFAKNKLGRHAKEKTSSEKIFTERGAHQISGLGKNNLKKSQRQPVLLTSSATKKNLTTNKKIAMFVLIPILFGGFSFALIIDDSKNILGWILILAVFAIFEYIIYSDNQWR